MAKELVKVEKNGVSAFEVYQYLGISTKFSTWFARRVTDYGFKSGEDFVPILGESSGGRPREDYILSTDMAKELAMVEKTEKGRQIRKYLIEVENTFRNQLLRDSTKITRRTLTDVILDSGENGRMHGHAYSNYTLMVYKKLGIKYVKMDNFRDTLTPEQLKAVEALEKLAEGYLRLGFDYNKIKDAMPEMIVSKQAEMLENV